MVFAPVPARHTLYFNILCVSCLEEFVFVSSGIDISIKFGIQFTDKKRAHGHIRRLIDPPFFILFQFISILLTAHLQSIAPFGKIKT